MKFFYIIKLSHNGVLGYGITSDPQSRLQDYISHSAEPQEFTRLYYGDNLAINALETYVKKQWKPYSKKLNNWVLEWIDPKHNKTVEELVALVDDKILGHPLPVKKVKDDFLPFNYPSDITRENLEFAPDKYLAEVKVDKKRKKVV